MRCSRSNMCHVEGRSKQVADLTLDTGSVGLVIAGAYIDAQQSPH